MAGRIPQSFIDDLMSRVDIVDVVESRIALRKAGKEYQACCPFHDEKSPSFSVSPQKQFYHCFGCGAHGTAVSFLMEYDHMGFVEAIEELASRVGMEVPREGVEEKLKQHFFLYDLMGEVASLYQQQLKQRPQSDGAVAYLKGRGLSGQIAKEFGMGYAPPGWSNLVVALGAKNEKALIEAGMLIKKEDGRSYDRFRDRVMFPIRDQRGRVIAFGGRVLGDETPKYLNSPETPIFQKGKELYGLFEVRQAVRKLERIVVVEGYMDVVALAQYDVKNAVATLGTAMTPEHIQRLFRVVSEVVCCFDGDRAGREAAWRALENSLPHIGEGKQLRFMFLPDGDDPDTLVRREGREGFESRLGQASSFSEFFYHVLSERVDMKSLDGRSKLVELAKPLIERIPQGVFQHMMMGRLAELSGIQQGELSSLLGVRPVETKKRFARAAVAKAKGAPSMVRKAIFTLLHYPEHAALFVEPKRMLGSNEAGVDVLVGLIELLHQRPNLSCGAILEHLRETPEGELLAKIAGLSYPLPEEGVEAELRGVEEWLMQKERDRRLHLLAGTPMEQLSDTEKLELRSLLGSGGK